MKSFVPISADSDFTIYNLPWGVFTHESGTGHIGVAIGDQSKLLDEVYSRLNVYSVLDCHALVAQNNELFAPHVNCALSAETLNQFMSLGKAYWTVTRNIIQTMLLEGSPNQELVESCLVAQVGSCLNEKS